MEGDRERRDGKYEYTLRLCWPPRHLGTIINPNLDIVASTSTRTPAMPPEPVPRSRYSPSPSVLRDCYHQNHSAAASTTPPTSQGGTDVHKEEGLANAQKFSSAQNLHVARPGDSQVALKAGDAPDQSLWAQPPWPPAADCAARARGYLSNKAPSTARPSSVRPSRCEHARLRSSKLAPDAAFRTAGGACDDASKPQVWKQGQVCRHHPSAALSVAYTAGTITFHAWQLILKGPC